MPTYQTPSGLLIQQRSGSKQPYYQPDTDNRGGWSSYTTSQALFNIADNALPPPYAVDSRNLDNWLIEYVRKEPLLHGVVNQAASLVQNRGWTLTGSKRGVQFVKNILHNANHHKDAPYGDGWREYAYKGSYSWFTTCMGHVTETRRDSLRPDLAKSENAKDFVTGIWNVDPTRLVINKLSGPKSLKYYPVKRGKLQYFSRKDYIRICANKDIRDEYKGLGYPPVLAAIGVARILVGMYRYEREKLGAQAPKGLLLLENIDQYDWDNAMRVRQSEMAERERLLYGDVAVIAAANPDNPINAKLIELSQLPDGFNRDEMVEWAIKTYALLFGFPVEEFWPANRLGGLGYSSDAQIAKERATQKGDANYFLHLQEVFQREWRTIEFAFQERGDEGRALEAEAHKLYVDTATKLYEAGEHTGQRLLPRADVLRWLVEKGVLDEDVTILLDHITKTDEDTVSMRVYREKARRSKHVRASAKAVPSEPIVRYNSMTGDETVLWSEGSDLFKPINYRVGRKMSKQNRAVVGQDNASGFQIEDADVTAAISAAIPSLRAFLSGDRILSDDQVEELREESIERAKGRIGTLNNDYEDGSIDDSEFLTSLRRILLLEYIRQYLMAVGGVENATEDGYNRVASLMARQLRYLDGPHPEDGKAPFARSFSVISSALRFMRMGLYINSARSAFEWAKVAASRSAGLTGVFWELNSNESCLDCEALNARGEIPLDELDQVPGDGSTLCLSACQCKLRFV